MWIRINEKYPEAHTGVLVTDGYVITCAEWDDHYCCWAGHESSGYEWEFDFDTKRITHWMPLPPLPDEEIRENILKGIMAAQKRLDEQDVPVRGRKIAYWTGEKTVVVDIDTGEIL